MVQRLLGKLFKSRNDRLISHYKNRLKEINDLEDHYQSMSDEDLKEEFKKLKTQVNQQIQETPSISHLNKKEYLKNIQAILNPHLPACFAITREASRRILNMRHFDVQLIGGMALHDGRIAEMKTGEGKTLVATLPVILNSLLGYGIHVVTVNDYLAYRDAKLMEPLYEFLGLSVGIVTGEIREDKERIQAYSKDIVYGTNNEFGFDYLRDNMKYDLAHKVQKKHFFAIVDEVDSILIDEARTPLIISGPVNRQMEHYQRADSVAKKMQRDEDFSIDEKNRVILISDAGIKKAETLFGVENLYSIDNASLSHHLDQALKANYLFAKDRDYVVNEEGEVVIVDEFTGRLSEGRRFSEGLHQAIEAKENVKIKEESQTLADITFQNYFRLYHKLAGMTGTAQTEATEFLEIYNLEVVSIPTNLPILRTDLNDLIYRSEAEKFEAVVTKILELHKKGQPVLVGTASIEKSEVLHSLLKKRRIPHTVLNAKQHHKEAEIIKDAGLKGAVTIATNMAGRGVDIKLSEEVKELGGLYIIGTERHESRRIDNQLRGRSGRQGDPGVSQFYLSLEDPLMRIFGGDRIKGVMERVGLKDGQFMESSMMTRTVERAQKKIENLHFESRKHLLEYDDVANEQRKTVYEFRNELLNPDYDIANRIKNNQVEVVEGILNRAGILPGQNAAPNLEGVVELMRENFNLDIDMQELKDKEYTGMASALDSLLTQKYEKKMSVLDKTQRSEVERIIYLQVLDNSWREHLYLMDSLKTGIGLRGYNQKDPLVEYKKESYNLFMELILSIKLEALKLLHVVQFEPKEVELQTQGILNELDREAKQEISNEYAPLGSKKIARNDSCPCGSGKKFKHCHGKSGPKKGLLVQRSQAMV